MCDNKVPKKLKVLIYMAIKCAVLLYRSETWPVTNHLAGKGWGL